MSEQVQDYLIGKLAVYLSGAVNGITWQQATDWRNHAVEVLESAGYTVINPLRERAATEVTSRDIVNRDLRDITCSDIVLVEMDHAGIPYIGTAMEIRYAWEREKEIILWGMANHSSHWLAYHASRWFDTLDDALQYLVERKVVR